MRQQCVQAMESTVGRSLKPAEIKDIESRMQVERTRLGSDPSVMAMGSRDRLLEAAKRASAQFMADNSVKLRRVLLQAEADSRNFARIKAATNGHVESLRYQVSYSADMRSDVQAVDSQVKAIVSEVGGMLMPFFEATHAKWGGMIGHDSVVQIMVRELFGENTGNAEARAAAQSWVKATDFLRDRANAAGATIGKLEKWVMAQTHDRLRVSEKTQDAWVDSTIGRIDRDAYLNERGERLSEDELRAFLSHAWESIVFDGAAARIKAFERGEAVRSGGGSKSNQGSESRMLHFKDAESWKAYQDEFGEAGGAYATMMSHVRHMASQIALMETFGPNPDYAFQKLLQYASDLDVRAGNIKPTKEGRATGKVEADYRAIAGLNTIEDPSIALIGNTVMSANRILLGSSYVSSITDHGMMRMTAYSRGLGFWNTDLSKWNHLTNFNLEEKAAFNHASIGLQIFLNDVSRFGSDGYGVAAVDKVSNFVIRAGAMPKATEARRRAYGGFMTSAVGDVVMRNATLAAMDAGDARIMKGAGITEADYAILRLAKQEDWTHMTGFKADTMLTVNSVRSIPDADIAAVIGSNSPKAIKTARDKAAQRLLGFITDETHTAVLEPSTRDATTMDIGMRGTWKGILIRSCLQFKSFPISFWNRHIMQRAQSYDNKMGMWKYRAGIIASSTVLGYIAAQMAGLRDGKDIQDPTQPMVVVQSLLKGGSLSIYGDFMLSTPSLTNPSFYASFAGPTVSTADKTVRMVKDIAIGAFDEDKEWEDIGKKAASNGLNISNSYNPLHTLLWTRPVFDHMILHDLQEAASEGYLDRARDRAYKEYGQEHYWDLGENMPDRLPQLAKGAEQ
jgi:hypothetical protein